MTRNRQATVLSQTGPPANSYVMCPTDAAPSHAPITKDTMTKTTSADTSPDVSPSVKADTNGTKDVEFSTKYVKDGGNGEEERVLICKKEQNGEW